MRIRNWCPYSGSHSQWDAVEERTLSYYSLRVQVNHDGWGTVTGNGEYLAGTYVTMTATPASNYHHFAVWSDGVLYASRVHQTIGDTTFTALFICDTCTESVADMETLPFSLTPDPTGGELIVNMEQLEPCQAAVYDVAGRCVLRATLQGSRSVLDVRRLPAGRYLLRLTSGEKTGSRAFIKR